MSLDAMLERMPQRLEGRLVVLEALRPDHEELLWAAARDARVWDWMTVRGGDDREAFRGWFEAARAEAAASQRIPFATIVDGEPLGSTSYLSLRPEHRSIEIGHTWLASRAWGSGANTEAKYLLLRHAFDELRCLRVEFKTDAKNERARAALAGLPAQFEGIHRKHMLVRRGERRDSAWYSVIDDEWPDVKAALETRIEMKSAGQTPV
jgi:RimJ/RimL family protein N-acetyltransferase